MIRMPDMFVHMMKALYDVLYCFEYPFQFIRDKLKMNGDPLRELKSIIKAQKLEYFPSVFEIILIQNNAVRQGTVGLRYQEGRLDGFTFDGAPQEENNQLFNRFF